MATARKLSKTPRQRALAARKAQEAREAKARQERARRGWETRRARQAEEERAAKKLARKRARAAKKGWETRRVRETDLAKLRKKEAKRQAKSLEVKAKKKAGLPTKGKKDSYKVKRKPKRQRSEGQLKKVLRKLDEAHAEIAKLKKSEERIKKIQKKNRKAIPEKLRETKKKLKRYKIGLEYFLEYENLDKAEKKLLEIAAKLTPSQLYTLGISSVKFGASPRRRAPRAA